jgi:hypothetical protein
MSHYGIPGPGGSMGTCALCGENFLAQIITGARVKSFTVDQAPGTTFYGHDKCLEQFAKPGLQYTDLPEGSPLRQAFERAAAKEAP